MTTTPAISSVDLAKEYRLGFAFNKRVNALRGVSFSVAPGEVFGLIGPNGAGKSTTIKILLNLIHASSGHGSLFGVDSRDSRARSHVSYVPENPTPYEYLTGREYLELQAQLLDERLGAQAIDQALERVGMAGHARMQIRRYSKGMVQRTILAGAILGTPRLIVLDEPTSGLDPLGRRLVRDIIVEQRQRGAAILFCTHIISDVESLCDRVALLVGGKVVKEGRVNELVSDATTSHEVIAVDEAGGCEKKLTVPLLRCERVGSRLIAQVDDSKLQALLAELVRLGVAITRVQPVHFSLEDQFVESIRAGTVGGKFE